MSEFEGVDVIADPVEKIACRKCGRHLDVSKLAAFSKVDCPDCGTRQTVPALLGNFLLLEILGAGGMGAVYQALDKQLGRYVAIKVMKRSLGDDPAFVDNFLREARAAAALNHRNIVQIYSCGQEKGQPYIVMELVSGGRFDEIISSGNPVEEVRALEIGVDVAEGLKAANDIGLIHGDIKPANVLFDKDGVAKVADFGLARFVAWQQQDRGEVWGTPYYIAPEKARGQKVDHRSDIYSLGATLYHALGAKPPFDGKTATDVVLARLKNPAIGLRVVRPTLQPETADVIARMLEADPFMRYPTYASLLADLREALRVAKQEHRAIRAKVKKSPAAPVVIIIGILLAAAAILISGLRMSAVRKEKAGQVPPPVAPTQAVTQVDTNVVPDTPKKVIPKEQPFSPAGEQQIVKAVNLLAQGKPAAMGEQLQALYDKSPPLGVARYWIRLFQAVSSWGGGHDQDALLYLKEIRNAVFDSPDPALPHPGTMPQALARYMLKEIEDGALMFEASRRPQWYGHLAEFFVGLDYLREGNVSKATDSFKAYVANKGADPVWPYSLQPVAKVCLAQMATFSSARDRARQFVAAKQAAKASAVMQEVRFKSSALLFPLIDHELALAQAAEQKEAAEQKRVELQAKRENIQADLDRLDEVHTANLPLVAVKDFRKASAAVIKLIPEMKTAEGQQMLATLREVYDRMDALKKYLMDAIGRTPFRGGGTELGGDAVGADLNGIQIRLGQHGAMVIPWEQVSARTFLQLASFYLGDASLPDKDKADLALSTAVYCYENGGFKPAVQYAEQAVKLDPDAKQKVRRLMPDILPD